MNFVPSSRPSLSQLTPVHCGVSRREMLLGAGAGFGAIPLSWMLQPSLSAAEGENSPASAHRAKVPHRLGRAKSVIFLFMEGGPSHIDTFDPKPKLKELAGQKLLYEKAHGRAGAKSRAGLRRRQRSQPLWE